MNNGTARFGILIAVVVIAALLAGTWFVGIGPRLNEVAAADDEREGVELVNRGHESTLERLRLLNDDLPALKEELDVLRAAFPGSPDIAAYYREVESIGAISGVSVSLVGFEGPDVYEALEETDSTNAELQAALGSVNPDNFLTMSVTIEFRGPYEGVMDAIARLQSTNRYALIHDIQLQNGLVAGDPEAVGLVTGQMFILRTPMAAPVETETTE